MRKRCASSNNAWPSKASSRNRPRKTWTSSAASRESSKEGPEGFEPSTNGLHAEHSVTDVQPLTEVPLREYLCKRLVALNLHRCYRRSITSLGSVANFGAGNLIG